MDPYRVILGDNAVEHSPVFHMSTVAEEFIALVEPTFPTIDDIELESADIEVEQVAVIGWCNAFVPIPSCHFGIPDPEPLSTDSRGQIKSPHQDDRRPRLPLVFLRTRDVLRGRQFV